MKLDKMAVIYCRVSTDAQEQEGTSLDTQEEDCRKYAVTNGYTVLRVISEAKSGTILTRKGLDEVRDMVARHEVEAVIIWHPDRLTRGGPAHMFLLLDEFSAAGTKLLFVTQPLEQTPEGKVLFGVMTLFADYERTKIAERTRRGKARRAKEGRILPGPKVTYGYSYAEGNYEINESEAQVVRMMFDLLTRQHLSCNAIANTLTDRSIPAPGGGQGWRRTTVHRILTNETYTGIYRYGKYESTLPKNPQKDARERKREKSAQVRRDHSDTIPVSCPVIVDLETFDRAQARLQANKSYSPRNERHPYLLRSLIFCSCGRRYAGSFTHGSRVYVCPSNQSYNKAARCGARQYQADVIERGVWESIKRRISDGASLLECLDAPASEIEREIDRGSISRLDHKQTDLRRKEERMREAYEAEVLTLDEWREYRMKAQAQERQIATDRVAIEERETARKEASVTVEQVAQIRAWFYMYSGMQPSFTQKRRMLEKMQVRVTVDGERVLVTGLLTESVIEVDLDEARILHRLDQAAWDDLLKDIADMKAEGRTGWANDAAGKLIEVSADEVLEGTMASRANGTLILSITPPTGAIVHDSSRQLAAFMSPSAQ